MPSPPTGFCTIPGLLRWAQRGSALVLRHRPAFLWAGNLKPAGHVTHWLARRHGVPYGVILYGTDVLRLKRQVERSRMKRLIARWLLGDADRIAAISSWTLDQAVDLSQTLGIAALGDRSEVIPLGVDAGRFRPGAGGGSREALRRGASHWMLSVCRLVSHKGVDTALEVLAALRGRGLDVGYLVAGEGPEAAALSRRASFLCELSPAILPKRARDGVSDLHARLAAERLNDQSCGRPIPRPAIP